MQLKVSFDHLEQVFLYISFCFFIMFPVLQTTKDGLIQMKGPRKNNKNDVHHISFHLIYKYFSIKLQQRTCTAFQTSSEIFIFTNIEIDVKRFSVTISSRTEDILVKCSIHTNCCHKDVDQFQSLQIHQILLTDNT